MAIRGLGVVSGIHPDKLASLQKLASGRAPTVSPGTVSTGEGTVTGKPVEKKPFTPTGARPSTTPGKGSDLLTRIAERIMAERRAKQRGSYLR